MAINPSIPADIPVGRGISRGWVAAGLALALATCKVGSVNVQPCSVSPLSDGNAGGKASNAVKVPAASAGLDGKRMGSRGLWLEGNPRGFWGYFQSRWEFHVSRPSPLPMSEQKKRPSGQVRCNKASGAKFSSRGHLLRQGEWGYSTHFPTTSFRPAPNIFWGRPVPPYSAPHPVSTLTTALQ